MFIETIEFEFTFIFVLLDIDVDFEIFHYNFQTQYIQTPVFLYIKSIYIFRPSNGKIKLFIRGVQSDRFIFMFVANAAKIWIGNDMVCCFFMNWIELPVLGTI